MTKFKLQALHTTRIKYWKTSGSGNPLSFLPALRKIAIYVLKMKFSILFCTRPFFGGSNLTLVVTIDFIILSSCFLFLCKGILTAIFLPHISRFFCTHMLEKDQMIRRCIKEYRVESMNYIMFLDIQWSRVYMNFFDILTINFVGGKQYS